MGFFDDVADAVSQAAPQLPSVASVIQNPSSLVAMGAAAAKASPIVGAAASLVPQAAQSAFHLGIAAAQHAASPAQLSQLASSIAPSAQNGFNLAIALMHGAKIAPPIPPAQNVDPVARAAWLAVFGSKNASPAVKATIAAPILANPTAKFAASAATAHFAAPSAGLSIILPGLAAIASMKPTTAAAQATGIKPSLWHRLMVLFHLSKT